MLNFEIKGEGFPILCLHGHPGAGQSLSVFTDHLSKKFKTIAPDLRGYGKSPPQGQFHMSDHLSDLEELLSFLKIDRCLILGWSLGGILAIELILRDPERFSGLILVASAARPYGDHPKITWQDLLYTAVAGGINYLKPGWEWNIEAFGKRSLFRYLIHQQTSLAYSYIARYGVSAYLQTSKAADKALSVALKEGYNRLEQLNKINCPCLVLAGALDRHINASSSQETAKKLANCRWICYPNTAHLFPWEIPTQVIQDLDCWLEQHREVTS